MSNNENFRQSNRRANAALWLSAVALALALTSLLLALRAESRAYEKVLSEVDECVRPLYRDFSLQPPTSKPESLKQLIAPLFESVRDADSR
jgi:hypothetical protein